MTQFKLTALYFSQDPKVFSDTSYVVEEMYKPILFLSKTENYDLPLVLLGFNSISKHLVAQFEFQFKSPWAL